MKIKVDNRKTIYTYKAKLAKKGQVHKKLPHFIVNKITYAHHMDFLSSRLNLIGPYERRIKWLKMVKAVMESIMEKQFDIEKPISYFAYSSLREKRLVMHKNCGAEIYVTKIGRDFLEMINEALELYQDEESLPDAETVRDRIIREDRMKRGLL